MSYLTNTTPIQRPGHGIFHRFGSLLAAAHRRRAFNKMLQLDDHLLEDMGVTRTEVQRAARLPLWVDAGEELLKITVRRRRERK